LAILSSACVLAFLLGAIRYDIHIRSQHSPDAVVRYNESDGLALEGIVSGYPDERDTWTELTLDIKRISPNGQWQPAEGRVLASVPRFPEFGYGDRLQVSGDLETPPDYGGYYRDYLARKGVHSTMRFPHVELIETGQGNLLWSAIYALRARASNVIARLIPDPEASLLQGIVLGIESGIPKDLYDDYRQTGTSHIIVISGANIVIVASLFSRSFGRLLGRRRAYTFTLAGIFLYVLLVGADPVVVRAGIMGGLYVTAVHLGRRATAYVSLLVSTILLTVINPLALWDVGFQLSFAATLGLILFTAPIEGLFERGLTRIVTQSQAQELLRYLNDVLIVTLAAQILVIPVIIYHFGSLSLVSPFANLLILPVQPPIVTFGGLSTAVGLVPFLEPLARALGWVPWLCLAYCNTIVRWMASWPLSAIELGKSAATWSLLLAILLLATLRSVPRLGEYTRAVGSWARHRPVPKLVTTLLLIAGLLAWLAVLQLPDGKLHVTFLNVGQGDAIFIITPTGRQILIDGGPSPTRLTSALGRAMPFWDRAIDVIVLTHSDADHITGLEEVLERFRVDMWLDSGYTTDNEIYAQCQSTMKGKGTIRRSVMAGDRLELEPGILLEVLNPPNRPESNPEASANDSSVVARLTWLRTSFLLTGDLETAGEQWLIRSGSPIAANVLKVSHHGSAGSTTSEFLATVDPSYAVISVGAENRFGHPAQPVLDRLEQQGNITVLRTDVQGTIDFATDGRRIWIHTEK
jgi:competence protein ComEC